MFLLTRRTNSRPSRLSEYWSRFIGHDDYDDDDDGQPSRLTEYWSRFNGHDDDDNDDDDILQQTVDTVYRSFRRRSSQPITVTDKDDDSDDDDDDDVCLQQTVTAKIIDNKAMDLPPVAAFQLHRPEFTPNVRRLQ